MQQHAEYQQNLLSSSLLDWAKVQSIYQSAWSRWSCWCDQLYFPAFCSFKVRLFTPSAFCILHACSWKSHSLLWLIHYGHASSPIPLWPVNKTTSLVLMQLHTWWSCFQLHEAGSTFITYCEGHASSLHLVHCTYLQALSSSIMPSCIQTHMHTSQLQLLKFIVKLSLK